MHDTEPATSKRDTALTAVTTLTAVTANLCKQQQSGTALQTATRAHTAAAAANTRHATQNLIVWITEQDLGCHKYFAPSYK